MFHRIFFKKYSFVVLIYTLLTMVWGVWVRLSGSGDGCGKDWPLCKQSFLPTDHLAFIEWTHRLSSGFCLLLICGLWLLSLKIYPKHHLIKKLTSLAFVLIVVEALIGALLVLESLVAFNPSNLRVFVLAFHLINSLVLIAVLTLCHKAAFWNQIQIEKPQFYFVLAFPLLALTGNIASLAGMLFPTLSLSESLALDFLPTAHITLKLRILHPVFALLFVFLLGGVALFFKKNFKFLFFFALFAALFGFITLINLSPLWMKISHLWFAYLLWIYLVHLSWTKPQNTNSIYL